jgi:hypothetical protein
MAWNIKITGFIGKRLRKEVDRYTSRQVNTEHAIRFMMENGMPHPLEFLPLNLRKPLFFTFLALTVVLFAVFRVLDEPLRTAAAPNGIVSFEFAGLPDQAEVIVSSWNETTPLGFPQILGGYSETSPVVYAAFGLGLDYLFMPVYSLALSLGTLLAAGRHAGWLKSLGAVAGWGAFGAAIFDAVENYALWRVLSGDIISPYPEIAAVCAVVKFFLISWGLLYAIVGWIIPKQSHI